MAETVKLSGLPSAMVLFPIGFSTGAWLASETVTVMVSVSMPAGEASSWTVTEKV